MRNQVKPLKKKSCIIFSLPSHVVGTVFYVAPELSTKTCLSCFELKKADIWAVGVMDGLLIMGRPPVMGNNADEIRMNAVR